MCDHFHPPIAMLYWGDPLRSRYEVARALKPSWRVSRIEEYRSNWSRTPISCRPARSLTVPVSNNARNVYNSTILRFTYTFLCFGRVTAYAVTCWVPWMVTDEVPNLCCYIHSHSLSIYAATYTLIPCQFMLLHTLSFPVNLCWYIHSHSLSIYAATYTLIPCQFMLPHTLSFPVNLCCYIHSHSLSIYAATYTLIPCQFMLLHALSFPVNLCCYIHSHSLSI